MSRLDPRVERRRTRDGDGARWELLSEEVFDRDGHTCQRCGYDASGSGSDEGRQLQAHHIATHASPSFEKLDDLVTVCEPCHATLHSDDPAYDDARARAPMFPRPDAPAAVSTMRNDRQHICQRCQYVAEFATELAAYTHDGRPYVLCKPCAGALLEAGYDPDGFEVAGDVGVESLRERATDAPVRPVLLASRPVRTARPPETRFERVVYDTPLRYVLNPIGLTALFILVGVLFSFYVF